MAIKEAARILTMPGATATRKVREWNTLAAKGPVDVDLFLYGKKRGRPVVLNDQHTVFMSDTAQVEPNITVKDMTDLLCEKFEGLKVSESTVRSHMHKKCLLTYKRVIPQYFNRDAADTVMRRHDAVLSWMNQGINFMEECIFIDEAGFNRNMHRPYGWSSANSPCKVSVETKGPNVSIIGAICKDGIVALLRREVFQSSFAQSSKQKKSRCQTCSQKRNNWR